MKKQYEVPEWEMISFSVEEMRIATSGCVSNDCKDDCGNCFYLVCEPQDVQI